MQICCHSWQDSWTQKQWCIHPRTFQARHALSVCCSCRAGCCFTCATISHNNGATRAAIRATRHMSVDCRFLPYRHRKPPLPMSFASLGLLCHRMQGRNTSWQMKAWRHRMFKSMWAWYKFIFLPHKNADNMFCFLILYTQWLQRVFGFDKRLIFQMFNISKKERTNFSISSDDSMLLLFLHLFHWKRKNLWPKK